MTLPSFARLSCGGLLALLLGAGAARSQKAAEVKAGDRMIDAYLAKEAARISQRVLDGATTRAEWEKRRPRLYREYLDMLGLWPLPEKTPLKAAVTGTLEREGVVIEKLYFQSRPGLYVTGNLYRPRKVHGKLPAVLYVCGHSGRGRDGNKTAFQDHGMWFGTNGYVCLVIDTLQLGEVPGIHHGTYNHGRWWWQARGYTPAGVECWNGVRAIDYLVGRPDVDPDRIAVTGISGGGAATIWISAADERVKCAVPVSGMSDLESYVSHKIINRHCDCMLMINTYGWEWTTIAALIAPRPMLFCNSDNDDIFPMDGNRRIIARLRQLYKMYDKPVLVDDYVSHGGHAYRPDLRVAIFKWINKRVKNETGPVKDADFKPIPGKDLRVFPEDRDIPSDAVNGKIDETFVPPARVELPQAGDFSAWKKHLLERLREQSFRSFPRQVSAAKLHRALRGENEVTDHVLTTEEGIRIVVPVVFPKGEKRESNTLIVLGPEDSGRAIPDWARNCAAPGITALVRPRGQGDLAWTTKSPPNYVERAHALLGQTVDRGRVWDVAAAFRWWVKGESKLKARWTVVGRGQAGILAAYAALFEPGIEKVVVVDPPKSHRDGPIFLNVLRVLDIPEALGLLAPRRLTLVNAKDRAFDRTVEIYKRAGAEKNLQRK
jgi:cephalosporin-C deacetylase-like acetyl esterase